MTDQGYRYIGHGERWRELPARDIPAEEYAMLSPLAKRTLRESGAYEPMTTPATTPKATSAATPADDAKGDD